VDASIRWHDVGRAGAKVHAGLCELGGPIHLSLRRWERWIASADPLSRGRLAMTRRGGLFEGFVPDYVGVGAGRGLCDYWGGFGGQ
jgi:hypothetical protein